MKRVFNQILVVAAVTLFVGCVGSSMARAQSGEYLPTGGTSLISVGSTPGALGSMSGFGWTTSRLPSWLSSIRMTSGWVRNPSLVARRTSGEGEAAVVRKAR